ncbi:MAG: hypothetical protein ABL971_09185 [Vicinamibacterales bacterium]
MARLGWRASVLMLLSLVLAVLVVPASAAEPLDRILARVDGQVILLSDVRAARVLRLTGVPAAEDLSVVTHALVDRQLVLAEAIRGLPDPPDAARVEMELTAMRARAGGPSRVESMMAETGVTAEHLRRLARESVWIEAYLQQRFAAGLSSDTGQAWLGDLRRRASIACGVPGC